MDKGFKSLIVMNFLFFINAILLGSALSMDAFSISLANGLSNNKIETRRQIQIAGCFAFFQTIMPLIGWLCVHFLLDTFKAIQKYIPYMSLILLSLLGIKMIIESFKKTNEESDKDLFSFKTLLIQAIATSIDALSVGFTIAEYTFYLAFIETIIIGIVTFFICMFGLKLGNKFKTKIKNKATMFGGLILIFIGIEIFISHLK